MLGFRFIKFQPNEYILKYKNGRVIKEGPGISFIYHAPTTSIVAIPLGSVEVPFIFEEYTSDFQAVTIQGQVIYRIVDQKKIAQLLNYTLDIRGRSYVSDDPEKLSQRIINTVKVQSKMHLAGLPLKEAVRASERMALDIGTEMAENKEITSLGVEILGLSILAILPNKETMRALEAQAREEILRRADEAIYQRRNSSIEQERKIKENELNTEIAVESKKKQIRETQMEAERAIQQRQNQLEAEQLNFEITQEEKRKDFIQLTVENQKAEADAKAYELTAVMRTLEGMDPDIIQALASIGMEPGKLIALAFQGLAENAQKIGELNISPDLLKSLVKETK